MSLYGGINFKGQAKAPATPAAAAAAAPSESVSASASPAAETNNSNSGTESPAGQQVHAANEDKPKPATWSAALRFAPTVRKKPNSQGVAANARGSASAFALKSAFGAAADDDDGGNDGSPAARGSGAGAGMPAGYRMATVGKAALTAMPEKAPPVNKWSAVSRPVEEIKPFAGSSKANSASNMQRASPVTADSATSDPSAGRARARPRRIIANPPAMTLDDAPLAAATTPGTDVNGFEQSAAGKKLAAQQNKKRGGKKKRGGAGGAGPHEDPALAFADVPYDPTRPCDYSAYKTHLRLVREQRRLQREEEDRQRRKRRDRSYSGSSYYSEDEEDQHERRNEDGQTNKKARFFAPPSSYDAPPVHHAFPPPTSYDTPAAPPPPAETGDEAYARRLAMSQGGGGIDSARAPPPSVAQPPPPPREETGEEAYLRRAALSRRREETGEEAYARRMTLSQGGPAAQPAAPPPPPPPMFVSAASGNAPFVPPPPPPGFVPPPPGFAPAGFSPATAGGSPYHPPAGHAGPEAAAPAASDPASSHSAPGPVAGPAGNEALDAAQAKAREIAAKLSKLGGAFGGAGGGGTPSAASVGGGGAAGINPQAPAFAPASTAAGGAVGGAEAQGAPAEHDDRSFAERMMSRFGWEQGKGLGAQESGMTTALGVQRAPAAAATSKKAKKKDPEAAQAAPAGMAGRSVVVDASREQRLAEQRTQMGGDASRVVLLTNMCAPDEVDDDLNGEVAEEANKVGVAERCFVRIVPGETRDDEAVRIFLVMSGLAGGYNAVRSFDGRFFGGRTVRARFYPEQEFRNGQYDL
ncbi:hypothetical protein JCM8202_001553 [Rhodotorula sphaerocarpa]